MFLKSMLLVNGTSLSVGFIFVLCGSLWREDCSQDTQSFDHFPSFSTLNICDNRWQLRRRISHNTSFTLHWTKSPFTTWKQGDFDSSLEIKRVFAWSCSMEIIDSWFILANPEKMPHFYNFLLFNVPHWFHFLDDLVSSPIPSHLITYFRICREKEQPIVTRILGAWVFVLMMLARLRRLFNFLLAMALSIRRHQVYYWYDGYVMVQTRTIDNGL